MDLLTPLLTRASREDIKVRFATAAHQRPPGQALSEDRYPRARAMIQIGG